MSDVEMTSINIEVAKQRLQSLKSEYEERIQKITDHIYHPQDDLNQHWDDQAVAITQNEMRGKLLLEAEQGLDLVNSALLRIDHQVYGICAECGEEIENQRLEAVPYATKCIQHAT